MGVLPSQRLRALIAEGATTIACVDRQGQLREIPEQLIKEQYQKGDSAAR